MRFMQVSDRVEIAHIIRSVRANCARVSISDLSYN